MGKKLQYVKKDGTIQKLRIGKLYTYSGLKRIETEVAHCGDIVAVNGVIGINIGETIADPENPVAVPFVDIDEPTVSMTFSVNNGPLAGKEGKLLLLDI